MGDRSRRSPPGSWAGTISQRETTPESGFSKDNVDFLSIYLTYPLVVNRQTVVPKTSARLRPCRAFISDLRSGQRQPIAAGLRQNQRRKRKQKLTSLSQKKKNKRRMKTGHRDGQETENEAKRKTHGVQFAEGIGSDSADPSDASLRYPPLRRRVVPPSFVKRCLSHVSVCTLRVWVRVMGPSFLTTDFHGRTNPATPRLSWRPLPSRR